MPSAQAVQQRFDPLVERSRPVLLAVSRGLRIAGRAVQALSLTGAVGAALLTFGLVRAAGWWGLVGLLAGVFPWRGWLVGHHAVAGSGLLADPGRVNAAARASAGSGREWLGHVSALRAATRGRRFGSAARAVIGSGRSVWGVVSPNIEGAEGLRELAIWPKTVAGLGAAVACPVLLLVGALVALVSLVA
jgi:hypothetical protein